MVDESILTPLEVAEILKISKNTVYEMVKRGEINSFRVGNKVRIAMKDVEEYKNKTMKFQNKRSSNLNLSSAYNCDTMSYPNEEVYRNTGFVICGQDIILDILARHLQHHPNGVQALRSYTGSYNGLYELYHEKVQVATVHLWDGETNEYNIPYVKRMLPGVPAVIIHLANRMQGFYVVKNNPKGIRGWEDLKRKDISIINREKGSGSRILLDEHIKKMGIESSKLSGYERESTSHITVASTVARGGADIGIGSEKTAQQVKNVEFIPLQVESYDLVIRKEDLIKPHFKAIIQILRSEEFKAEIGGIGGYDLDNLGEIVAET